MIVNKSHRDFFMENAKRWNINYGGAGSAKSFSTAQKHLIRLISQEDHRFLICRKVARTLRASVFQLFKDIISAEGITSDFSIHKTDMTITYKPNNSELLFVGLDDIEKVKSIQGITGVWIEEASECDLNDVLELNRRVRGETKYHKQLILTFNPISHLHWLKKHFFDTPRDDVAIFHSTYKDNSFIDEEYKKQIEDIKTYDIQQYNIYALGEWGVLNSNVVYHNYDFKKHSHNLTTKDFGVLHIGLDFNIGGCVAIVCGEIGSKIYVVDMVVGYDTEEICTKLSQFEHDKIIYPDASGSKRTTNASRSDIQILRDNGYTINAPKMNPPVRDRINAVNRKFSMDEILIGERLDRVSFALQTQAYKENGEPEKFSDHQNGSIDDINDALGYYINRRFGLMKIQINNRAIDYA